MSSLIDYTHPDCPAAPSERDAERKRCLSAAFEVLQHGPGFDCSKEFADGYSLAAQEIAAAIQGGAVPITAKPIKHDEDDQVEYTFS